MKTGTRPSDAPAILRASAVTMDFPIRKGLLRRTAGHFRAVDQVDLDVHEGETLGLLGESGCGKSTLGRMLVGLLRPTSGRVEFRGRDISALTRPERRDLHRHLQIVFQDTADSLDPRMNIREIVSEGPRAHGLLEKHRLDQVVGEYLDLVGMPKSALEKYPHEFSGGQRQRIGIARALIMKPAVIVADEPISALDVSIQAHILALFDELKQAFNLTYVFISHNLAAVDYIADRTAVMYRGVIVEIATGRDLVEKPSHPFTQALLAALPGSRRELAEPELYAAADIPESSEVGCRFRQRCPYAQAVCATTAPPLRPIGEGHRAACHFAEHVSSAWTEREGSRRMLERAAATT